MSTEQKPPETQPVPHHKEHLQTNALGQSLVSGWEKFKTGQLISYKWMGIILISVAAIGVGLYIYLEKSREGSRLWVDLESANSRTALEKFAEQNPNSLVGQVAEFDLARVLLGPEGIERLPSAQSEAEQRTFVGNIEKSREMMTKLLDAFKDRPDLKVQCLVGLAKAEGALVGMYKEGSFTDSLGSVDKLVEWLDKIVAAAEGTPWAEEAKKMLESLKSPAAREEFVNVQRGLYTRIPAPPTGVGPFAPPKTPLDGIPGLPGGPTPKAPDPKTPEPTPKAPEPTPKAPAPKTPEPPKKGPEPVPPPKTPEPPKKGPEPVPPPKTPEPPKKGPEPVPPPKTPDPKPPEPPKKP